MTTTPTKSIHVPCGLCLCSAKLIEFLRAAEGDTLTDEDMTAHCGKDTRPDGNGNGSLSTAVRYVLRNDGIHWQRIRGARAIKRCTPSETVSTAQAAQKHIHRSSKRAVMKLNTVSLPFLAENERTPFLTLAAQLGTLAMMSSRNAAKQLEARNIQKPLDLPALLVNLQK